MSGLAELVSPEIAEVADEEELVTEAVRGGAVRGKVVEGEADGGGVAFAVPLGSDGVFLRFLDLVAGRSKDAGTCITSPGYLGKSISICKTLSSPPVSWSAKRPPSTKDFRTL